MKTVTLNCTCCGYQETFEGKDRHEAYLKGRDAGWDLTWSWCKECLSKLGWAYCMKSAITKLPKTNTNECVEHEETVYEVNIKSPVWWWIPFTLGAVFGSIPLYAVWFTTEWLNREIEFFNANALHRQFWGG